LISCINEIIEDETTTFRGAVIEGTKRRLRPVMLTAAIAALGLVPFLFATGPGAEIQRPLAIVVIGGLISATALTLLLLPILFDRFGVPLAARRLIDEKEETKVLGDGTNAPVPTDALDRSGLYARIASIAAAVGSKVRSGLSPSKRSSKSSDEDKFRTS